MPYPRKTYKRKTYKRKTYKRKTRFRKRRYAKAGRLRSTGSRQGIPDTLYIKLRMAHRLNISGAVNYIQHYSGNNPTAPDLTSGAANEPAYLDQMLTLYDRAVCNGSAIKIMPLNGSASANVQSAITCQAIKKGAETNPTSYVDAMVDPNTRYSLLSPNYQRPRIIKMFKKTKHVLGLKDVADNHECFIESGNFQGSEWIWQIYAETLNETNTIPSETQLIVQIDYYMKFSGRKDITDA